MSGCEFHVGQFDRTCCNGAGVEPQNLKDWIKLERGTLDWGDNSPCAHTDDPCTKCGKDLLPGFREEFKMTTYLYQAQIAAEAMNELVEQHPEWEAWDWL